LCDTAASVVRRLRFGRAAVRTNRWNITPFRESVMSRIFIGLTVAGALAWSAPARADALNIQGTAGFGFLGPVLSSSESGTVYWTNPSQDGSQANIGYYLLKTGMFASSPLGNNSPAIPGTWLQNWTGSMGQADPSLTFSATGAVRASL